MTREIYHIAAVRTRKGQFFFAQAIFMVILMTISWRRNIAAKSHIRKFRGNIATIASVNEP